MNRFKFRSSILYFFGYHLVIRHKQLDGVTINPFHVLDSILWEREQLLIPNSINQCCVTIYPTRSQSEFSINKLLKATYRKCSRKCVLTIAIDFAIPNITALEAISMPLAAVSSELLDLYQSRRFIKLSMEPDSSLQLCINGCKQLASESQSIVQELFPDIHDYEVVLFDAPCVH